MVNLVVVALLVTTAYADTLNVNGFTFLCQAQSGQFIPIANSLVRARVNSGFGFGRINFADKEWRTDGYGVLNIENEGYAKGESVDLWIDADCRAEYRKQCPGLNNICNSEGRNEGSKVPWKTISLPYSDSKQKHKFNGGFFLLRTPIKYLLAQHKSELPTHKMTMSEFCQVGKDGNRMATMCNFGDVPQYIHPESVNSDVTSAPAPAPVLPRINLTILCQAQSGAFIPIANSLVRAHVERGFGFGPNRNLADKQWRTDGYGVLNTNVEKFDDLAGVQLWIDYDCRADYRKQCPGLGNICVSEGRDSEGHERPWKTIVAPYSDPKQKDKFNGGFFLLRTANKIIFAKDKSELPTAKLSRDEFCEVPAGKPKLAICSFNDAP